MARTEPNEDDAPIRPKKPFPVWGWLLVAGVALATVFGGGVAVGALAFRGGTKIANVEGTRSSDPQTKPDPNSTPVKGEVSNASGTAPKAQTTTTGKKTFTRKELRAWLEDWSDKKPRKNAGDLKAFLGLPDSTTTVKGKPYATGNPGLPFSRTDYLEYHYTGLSVDSEGSGKTDSKTIIQMYEYSPHDFIRIEFIP